MLNVVKIDNSFKPKERLLSARDIMKIFSGVSQATLKNWCNRGFLHRHKIGGLVFYKESEVNKLIENSRE